jgi:flagellar assembly protein FliH
MGADTWKAYDMQPLDSKSVEPGSMPADFVSLQVDTDAPSQFIPLLEDSEEGGSASGDPHQNLQDKLARVEKEAYEKGFAQGEKDGLELGSVKAEKLAGNLEILLEEIAQLRSSIAKQYEGDIVALVYAIARTIIQTQVGFSDSVVKDTIQTALELTAEKSDITIKINPDDFEYVEKIRPELFSNKPTLKALVVTPDASIGRGGCLLETPSGDVDARIETQLANILQTLKEAYSA